MNPSLREIADDYAAHGLTSMLPAFRRSKTPMFSTTAYSYDPPSVFEREQMFSFDSNINIGFVAGAASNNAVVIDAESAEAFELQLRLCEQAGVADTWITQSHRAGHIILGLPVAVKGKSFQSQNFEVRGQGLFTLLPPSIHPKGSQYTFINRPAQIFNVASLAQLDWLKLEPAPPKPLPKKVAYLLSGKGRSYGTRSDYEQAIISMLVNAGYNFAETLALFRAYPAAGKFQGMHGEDPAYAAAWLERSFDKARTWCASDSPIRQRARRLHAYANSIPWPTRTGDADKTVLLAHLNLAHRSGAEIYHAGCREVAEVAGCNSKTAAKATKRLQAQGWLDFVIPASFPYASFYRLSEKTKLTTLPHGCSYGMYQGSSFLLPDAFRQAGLGRSAYSVLTAFDLIKNTHSGAAASSLRAKDISESTGRHVQTVRKALHRLKNCGLAEKFRGKWTVVPLDKIDLTELARKVGTEGARREQRDKHRGQRLRRAMIMKLNQEASQ